MSPKKRTSGYANHTKGIGQEREGHGMSINHVMDDKYFIDEFDTNDDSDFEEKGKCNYPKFRMEDLDKNFEFKLEMEFTYLLELKETMLEH